MRQQSKLWDSQRKRGKKRERENSREKPYPKALLAGSQNKGLSEYQKRASRLRTGPSPARGRGQEGASQSQKGAKLAPETASPTKLQTSFQFLTKTSWDSGRLTSARRVAARD